MKSKNILVVVIVVVALTTLLYFVLKNIRKKENYTSGPWMDYGKLKNQEDASYGSIYGFPFPYPKSCLEKYSAGYIAPLTGEWHLLRGFPFYDKVV